MAKALYKVGISPMHHQLLQAYSIEYGISVSELIGGFMKQFNKGDFVVVCDQDGMKFYNKDGFYYSDS